MKKLNWVGLALLITLIGTQLIPLSRANSANTQEVTWDSSENLALTQQTCFDCASNETVWPKDVDVAPIALWVVIHREESPNQPNFSPWISRLNVWLTWVKCLLTTSCRSAIFY